MLDRVLHGFEPFAQLDWASLATLARHARLVRVAPGRRMAAERIARGRYYLRQGKVRARSRDGVVCEIAAGTERARWPLVGAGLPANELPARLHVEIVTLTQCSLLWVDSAPIDFLLDEAPLAGYRVDYLYESARHHDWREQLIANGLRGIAPRTLKTLFDSFAPRIVRAGDPVFEEGAVADAFFVIAHGSADVWRDGRRLARLEAGDTFGEDALLSGRRRNATVRVMADAELMTLDRVSFDRLVATPLVRWIDAAQLTAEHVAIETVGEPRDVLARSNSPVVLTGADRGTRALWTFLAARRGVAAFALADPSQAGTVLPLAQARRLSMASARSTDKG